MSTEEFYSVFDSLWQKLQFRLLKFERIQSYEEPENPSFVAFKRGNIEEANRQMFASRARDGRFYVEACQRDVQMTRIRAVELPLSSYLRWEFQTYQITARFGERIAIADLSKPGTERLAQAIDFNLFDRSAALIPKYGPDGKFIGADFIEDVDDVSELHDFARYALAHSVPLAVFEQTHLT